MRVEHNGGHSGPGRGFRAARVITLTFTLFASLLFTVNSTGTPASAEINSVSQTSWGIANLGDAFGTADSSSLGWAIEIAGNTTFVGGNFLNVTNGSTSVNQSYFAAFDADTGLWQSWFRPNVNGAVYSILDAPDGGLFVGGEFTTWNGTNTGSLVKIDPSTGELWPGWTTQVSGTRATVRDLKIEADGRLYVVGDFSRASRGGNQITTSGAMRVDPSSGVIDASWLPRLGGGDAWGVSRSRTKNVTYLSGQFTAVNGLSARGFVGVDDAGNTTVNHTVIAENGCAANQNTCHWQFDVEATEFGTVWIGGVEHALRVFDESDFSLVRQHYTACNPAENASCSPGPWFGGDFQEIERVGDRIYASCHCWYDHYSDTKTIIHTSPTGTRSEIDSIAAYSPSTSQRITSFRPFMAGAAGGWGIAGNPSDGCVWMTGGIQTVGAPGSQRAAHNLVRLCDSGGAGPVNQPDPGPPAPATCTADVSGNSIDIAWTGGGLHTKTIIERQIEDGGRWFWRGAPNTGVSSFSESIPNDATRYRVAFRYTAGQTSNPVVCTSGGPAIAPASCTAVATSTSTISISWSGSANASAFVVSGSTNGGARAQIGSGSDTSLTTSVPAGSRSTFDVVAVSGDGMVSAPTACGAVRTARGSASGS